MFSIGILNDGACNNKLICIKFNNYDITDHLVNEEYFNIVITTFYLCSVFQIVGLLWIIQNNKHCKFEINLEDTHFTDKDSWYNTNNCKNINGQRFKKNLKQEIRTGNI